MPYEFKLRQQDAPRAQGELFGAPPKPGKRAAELLMKIREHYAVRDVDGAPFKLYETIDDLLAYCREIDHNQQEPAICWQSSCEHRGFITRPGTVEQCPKCKAMTMTAATVIAGERR